MARPSRTWKTTASTRATTSPQGPNGRLVYNYTGGSIGGPILKDKLFFFGDFLRISDHESSTVNDQHSRSTTSSNGNLDLSGYNGQVYDPNTGVTANCSTNVASTAVCGTGRIAFRQQPDSADATPASARWASRSCRISMRWRATRNRTSPRAAYISGTDHQQLLAESALQQRLHQLRHQVGLHHLAEGPPQRTLQPPDDQHLPGAALRRVPGRPGGRRL